MKLTQEQIILRHLRDIGDWVEGFRLEKVNTNHGWLSHRAMRTARELAEEGRIESRHEGKYVEYRAKQVTPQLIGYIPCGPNGERKAIYEKVYN